MANPPYVEPTNVAGQYQAVGRAAQGIGKGVAATYDSIRSELNNKASIQKMIDTLKSVGITENRMPGEDAETFGGRAAGKWAIYQTVANWKSKYPDLISLDPSVLTTGVFSYAQGRDRAATLEKQFAKQAEKYETAQAMAQKNMAEAEIQRGIQTKPAQIEGLQPGMFPGGPQSSMAESPSLETRAAGGRFALGGREPTREQAYGIALGTGAGEDIAKSVSQGYVPKERPGSPWTGLRFGASQEDRAIQQIQTATNSLKDLKQKKRNIWADVEADKLQISQNRRLTTEEKAAQINARVAKGHEQDRSADQEARMSAMIIYKNLRDSPGLQMYVPEDVMGEYEKYLKMSAKKPKDTGGLFPGGGGTAGGGAQGADKFVVGKKYKDAKGNVATYMGNGQWSQ